MCTLHLIRQWTQISLQIKGLNIFSSQNDYYLGKRD